MSDIVAIIPARWASTRLPGKALADIAGKPLIRHVYERVTQASLVSRVAVATDDERILRAVETFGGDVVMTSPDHASGTDRIAEAAKAFGGDIVVNVQGDEPFIDPGVIDAVCGELEADDLIVCATAANPSSDPGEYADPNTVKVVTGLDGRALYFSRSPVPYWRDGGNGEFLVHQGLYAYRREFLDVFTALEPTPHERAEKLEQLRMIEHGYRIGVVVTPLRSIGVDTPEDLEKARRMIGSYR